MSNKAIADIRSTRREVLTLGAGLALSAAASPFAASPALAQPEDMAREMKKLVGTAGMKDGRVKLSLPELTENGNSTPLGITVDSPMTTTDHVRAVHIFSEKNPVAYIARLGIGPRAGRAKVATSIRVAESQRVTVLAEMSDGSFWAGHAETVVTEPACIDDSRT